VEYWDLSNPIGGASCKVTLNWEDVVKSNILDMLDLRIAHFDGTKWTDHGGTGTIISETSGSIMSTIPFSSFSPITFGSATGDNPLPVTLVNFQASVSNGVAMLSWITASEQNNSHFEIQRSSNMIDFESISNVYSKAPGGNSNSLISYSTTDNTLQSGASYYRLKQIDYNGQFAYSPVASVSWDGDERSFVNDIKLYPNPTSGMIMFDAPMSLKGMTVQIYSSNGSIIKEQFIDNSDFQLDLSNYSNGLYMIKIGDGNDYVIRRIVKQ
ncbi:MAG: T9SS type A sorting domain-containing protein, partial [Salinivirgaceae bacterium]|nr:T9SS type A sorting domain-containing protein [Salinivirgaceae bacterium]